MTIGNYSKEVRNGVLVYSATGLPVFPRPHSFLSVAPTGTSSDGNAGSAVGDVSADPATLPRRKPAIYGYDSHDIEHALRGIEQALPFALAAFRCHLENNEHIASFVDFQGFADRLTDLVADDLRGPLQKRLDEMRGDR